MKGKSGELNGFLDRGAVFKGEMEFEDTMRIDGKFNGRITSKNELIVGESAHIEGDIHVGRIAISGTVVGKIVAAQRVEIHRNGKVYSDIDTPALIIEEGAIFEGGCSMLKAREEQETQATVAQEQYRTAELSRYESASTTDDDDDDDDLLSAVEEEEEEAEAVSV